MDKATTQQRHDTPQPTASAASETEDGIVKFFCMPPEMFAPGPVAVAQPLTEPDLFSWDVPNRHAGGVTDDRMRAAWHVQDELERARAGSMGTVRKVTLAGREYEPGAVLAVARREKSGDVLWTREP